MRQRIRIDTTARSYYSKWAEDMDLEPALEHAKDQFVSGDGGQFTITDENDQDVVINAAHAVALTVEEEK